MRRIATVFVSALLIAIALPALSASAAPFTVKAFPAADTKDLSQSETITGTITDDGASNAPVAGRKLNFKINTTNAAFDFDGGGPLPAGIGECTSNGLGQCSVTYSDVGGVGPDTIDVWDDSTNNHVIDGGEAVSTTHPAIDWVATGAGTKKVRIDMQTCDGDVTVAIDETTWNSSATLTTVGTVKEVCAARFAQPGDALTSGPVTFTITGGPGQFTDSTGVQNLGSTVTVDVGGGSKNHTWVKSSLIGTTTVVATAEGFGASGTIPWGNAPARIVDLSVAMPSIPPGGSVDATAHVTDRYGNDASGVLVTFTEVGPGSFSGGISSTTVTTGPTGFATATLFTTTSDSGTNTITASLNPDPAVTECSFLAGNPAGAPAGVCSKSKMVTVTIQATALSIGILPSIGTWGTIFQVSGFLTSGSSAISGRTISVYGKPNGASTFTIVGITSTDGAGRYVVTPVPQSITQYKATFGGDPSFGPATSGVVTALVRLGISFNQVNARIVHGQNAGFTGSVGPSLPGTKVFLQAFMGGIWKTVRTGMLDANSKFRFFYLKITPGRLLFRVVAPSNGRQLWNGSRNLMEEWI